MNLNKKCITSEKNRKKLKKVNKNWIVVSTSILSVVSSGLIYVNSGSSVHADTKVVIAQTTSNLDSANSNIATDITSSQTTSNADSSNSNSAMDSTSAQTTSNLDSANSNNNLSSMMLKSSLADDSSNIHKKMINSNPELVNPLNKQNFHYHNPQGHSNDVAGIIPHYDKDGNLDYWEGYYLWEPTDAQFGNEWYHFKTKDFSTFQPYDESDSLSLNNVAIPDPNITYNGERNIEVDKTVNKNDLPWDFIFSGSTFANNSKADGQSWYSEDQWGNKIYPDARIACFPSAGAVSYLAYSNDGKQFHPMQDHAIFDASIVGQPSGSDFRDQYVVPVNGGKQLVAYVASGIYQKVYILKSDDGINWIDTGKNIDISKIPQFSNDTVESPHVTTMNGTPIMFFGSQQTTDVSHSYVAYITGEFNSDGIFQTNANSQGGIVDTGVDSYGGNFTKLDDNHQISLTWLGNWTTFSQPHMGDFTLARVLNYSNDKMNSVPVEPGEITNETFSNLNSNNSLNIYSANKVSVNFNQLTTQFKLNLKRNDNAQFTITFDNGNLKIYRKNSINNNTDQVVNSVLTNKKLSNIQFFIDNISVEIYLPDEQKMYTFLSLNDTSNKPYQLTGDADAQVQNYQFDQSKSPSLLNVAEIQNNYQNTKNNFSNLISKLSQSENNEERVSKINLSINNVFNSINSTFSDVKYDLNQIDRYSNDARSHIYIALANNDLNLINTKLYQVNQQISNLNDSKLNGWTENYDGSWSYYDPDSGYKLTGNQNINGQNLYFNASGIQVKGSFVSNYDDSWSYYDANSGNRLTGRQDINGKKLYFNDDGIQVKGQIVNIDGKQMYFDPNSGELLIDKLITLNGINYKADSEGVLSKILPSSNAISSSSNSSSATSASSSSSNSSNASSASSSSSNSSSATSASSSSSNSSNATSASSSSSNSSNASSASSSSSNSSSATSASSSSSNSSNATSASSSSSNSSNASSASSSSSNSRSATSASSSSSNSSNASSASSSGSNSSSVSSVSSASSNSSNASSASSSSSNSSNASSASSSSSNSSSATSASSASSTNSSAAATTILPTTTTTSTSSSSNTSAISSANTNSSSVAASSVQSSSPSSSATDKSSSVEPKVDKAKQAKAAMNKAQTAVKAANKQLQAKKSKKNVTKYNQAVKRYYQAEKRYLATDKLYNKRYYYDFDQVNRHIKYVKVVKAGYVHNSKQFNKQSRVKKLKKDTKIKVNKIVRHGKTTRFNIGHNKFITGLKSFIHKLK